MAGLSVWAWHWLGGLAKALLSSSAFFRGPGRVRIRSLQSRAEALERAQGRQSGSIPRGFLESIELFAGEEAASQSGLGLRGNSQEAQTALVALS